MKRILITGGTGFLGTNLYHQFSNREPNSDIFLFSRRTGGNVKDFDQVDSAVKDKSLVIHAAAQTYIGAALKGGLAENNQFEQTNFRGTQNIIDACTLHKVPLIHVSTGEIYGSNINSGQPMKETHPFNPQMGTYAKSKLDADLAIQAGIKNGLNARIIRPSGMFGLFQTQEKFFPKLINQVKQGKPLTIHGKGDQIRDYSSVEDIAQAIWLIQKLPSGTIVNASNSAPYTLLQMAQLIVQSCKRHGLNGKIIHTKDRPNQVQEFIISHQKLHRLTGWKPKKLLESQIDRMVDFYLGTQIPTHKILYQDEKSDSKTRIKPTSKRVNYAAAVYGEEEVQASLKVLRSRWLAPANKTSQFQEKISALYGKKSGLFVNSGSSAVFLSVRVFDFPKGKEIITPASTFPTTVSAILQNNLTPVFVDSDLGTYNANINQIEEAISPHTAAILVPHIVGNLNDMPRLQKLAKSFNLRLIEDSCDTLGAKINGKPAGSWSDSLSASFYYVHHITAAGGGGMVMFDDDKLFDKAFSFRDWGRAGTGYDESLTKRFSYKINKVQYDSKFVSENFGYNFKGVEVQSAFGLEQVKKLGEFNQRRKKNTRLLNKFFKQYSKFFITPKFLPNSDTYLLSFPLTIKDDAPFNRMKLISYLEKRQIQTRPIFTGNILRHPGYKYTPHRQIGDLKNADYIMENAYVSPCHHALTDGQLDYLFETYKNFLKKF